MFCPRPRKTVAQVPNTVGLVLMQAEAAYAELSGRIKPELEQLSILSSPGDADVLRRKKLQRMVRLLTRLSVSRILDSLRRWVAELLVVHPPPACRMYARAWGSAVVGTFWNNGKRCHEP